MTWGFLQSEDDLDAGRVTLPCARNGWLGLAKPRDGARLPRREAVGRGPYRRTSMCDHCGAIGAWVFRAYGRDFEYRCNTCKPGGEK